MSTNPRVLASILFVGALAVEVSLLGLAHWQYARYQQRLMEQVSRASAPQLHTSGHPTAFAYLTNQPNPGGGEGAGRRLLAVLQTSGGERIADLGWQPNPQVPTAAPDFSPYQNLKQLELTGITLPLPKRRGWLQGPVFTTHPQLLAFLEPSALTSQTGLTTYMAATQTSPTLPGITPAPPALKSPAMHAGYALQWLAMAIAFPILCLNLFIRRRRKSPPRR